MICLRDILSGGGGGGGTRRGNLGSRRLEEEEEEEVELNRIGIRGIKVNNAGAGAIAIGIGNLRKSVIDEFVECGAECARGACQERNRLVAV